MGGKTESKAKIIKGLNELMETKYTNTSNPREKYGNEVDGPTNLDINRQNVCAAANLKNKINKEVPSSHVTPEDSGADDSDME